MKTKNILILLTAAILILILAVCITKKIQVYDMELKEYYAERRQAFEIPDIDHGFIPQGIGYDAVTDQFYLTGYMGNLKSSPIYIIDRETGALQKKINMTTPEGKAFRGHAGGLSVYDDQICIAGSTKRCVHLFAISNLSKVEADIDLAPSQTIDLNQEDDSIRTSFLSVDDTLLYAGEFYRKMFFPTHKSHRVVQNGAVQNAYLTGFYTEESGNLIPACVYSIPNAIQGACFADGYVFLSQGHGLLHGAILTWSLDELEAAGSRNVLGHEVPYYILTEENAKKITAVPAMPEEIIAVDNELYMVHESAANRYRIGRRIGLDHVTAVPLRYFE